MAQHCEKGFTPCIRVNPAKIFQKTFSFANVVLVSKNVNPALCCPYPALFIFDFVSF